MFSHMLIKALIDLKSSQCLEKNLKFYNVTLANQNQVKKLIKFTTKPEIVSYINLVGYLDNISYKKTNFKTLIKSITVNTLAPNLIKRSLIKNMERKNFGRILDISSIGGKIWR